MTSAAVLVAGLGSPHGDDQAGWLAVHHLHSLLRNHPWTANQVVARQLGSPLDLLPAFSEYQHVLICDAVRIEPAENSPACLRIDLPTPWNAQNLAAHCHECPSSRIDSHGLGLIEVLQLAELQLLHHRPQTTLFAIPATSFAPFTPTAPDVCLRAQITARHIQNELEILSRRAIC